MKLVAALASVLALGWAGSVAAQSNTPNSPPPLVQTVPVVLGEVSGVTSHSATVRTTRGETMNFETDSRTVMPVNLMSGKRVKVEFRLMESGTHHAGRITVIEPGSKDWDRYDEELAMMPLIDENVERASMEGDRNASTDREPYATNGHSTNGHKDHSNAQNELKSDQPGSNRDDAVASTNEDELPRTASRQPLFLGAGLAALALGLVIAFARRRRTV